MLTRSARAAALLISVAGCGQSGTAFGAFVADDMAEAPPDMATGGPTLDPGVVSRSARSAIEAETHVAAAPNGFVALAWIAEQANGASNNGYVFSKDDGATFEPVDTLASPGGRVSSDPVLTVDRAGNFWLTWIGFKRTNQGQTADMHVYVAEAPAGTTKFGTPNEVSVNIGGAEQYDKPWITVVNDGALLVTYARTSTGGILAARSMDGINWDTVVIVEDGGFRNLVFPCVAAGGSTVYATYHSGGGIGLRRSDDNGATWPDANKLAVADRNEGQPAFDDPTCAADGDQVWVAYGITSEQFNPSAATSAKLDSVRLAHSPDRGANIDGRYDAQDAAAGRYFLHPYLVREDNGALDIAYYAGASEGDRAGSFRRARSTDGGMTWGASAHVGSALTYTVSRASQAWLGDYTGTWWARNNLYYAFTTNAGGSGHVAFYRTASPTN